MILIFKLFLGILGEKLNIIKNLYFYILVQGVIIYKKYVYNKRKNKKTKFNLNYICYKCLIFSVVKEGN